jgi:hypothetical protein
MFDKGAAIIGEWLSFDAKRFLQYPNYLRKALKYIKLFIRITKGGKIGMYFIEQGIFL